LLQRLLLNTFALPNLLFDTGDTVFNTVDLRRPAFLDQTSHTVVAVAVDVVLVPLLNVLIRHNIKQPPKHYI